MGVLVAIVAISAVLVGGAIALVRRRRRGIGRLFHDQTYHHQALRALNHAAVHGADVSEVLDAITHVRAGDARGWFAAWQALGDRNRARADAARDPTSRGRALLRAHTYYLRSEFFLAPDDPARAASYDRNRDAFYAGLAALGVAHERIRVPFGEHHLNAIYYPAPAGAPPRPLILFCGGSDTTVEELYFFLAAAAQARGHAVLTFEGPGQGAVVREQGLPMTREWEHPTQAVLDAFLAAHDRPRAIAMVGLSLGGYLAARAAAFEPRVDALVCYDVFFDGREVARRLVPRAAHAARRLGLGRLVDRAAPIRARFHPASQSSLVIGRLMFGASKQALEIHDAIAAFTLEDTADRIRQHVLVLGGVDDQFVPVAQVDRLARALVGAKSVTTKVYDRASGGAEHSQLGATSLWQADLFDWLDEKLG
jgi:pimeloyl-ACP methyl ester carboxylesterase